MLEAIEACERIAGRELTGSWARSRGSATTAGGSPTSAPFEADYPDWKLRYGIEEILQEMYEQNVERWTAAAA